MLLNWRLIQSCLIHSFCLSVSVLIWPLQTTVREWQTALVFTLTVPSNQWEARCLNRNEARSGVPGSGALPCAMICPAYPLEWPCRLVLLLFFGFLRWRPRSLLAHCDPLIPPSIITATTLPASSFLVSSAHALCIAVSRHLSPISLTLYLHTDLGL